LSNFSWLNTRYCKTIRIRFKQGDEEIYIPCTKYKVKSPNELIIYPPGGSKTVITPEQVIELEYTRDTKVLICSVCGLKNVYKTKKPKYCRICGGELMPYDDCVDHGDGVQNPLGSGGKNEGGAN